MYFAIRTQFKNVLGFGVRIVIDWENFF